MKKFLTLLVAIVISSQLFAKEVHYIDQKTICQKAFRKGAILRKDRLFTDDFLTLHCLLRMSKPLSVFEIGTCTGEGTLIIKNAVGRSVVYSLELPLNESTYDIGEAGKMCYLPYIQIVGNSMTLNYADYFPIEAWFIDGAHEYSFVLHETREALLSYPKIIVWHDADIPEVLEGICDGLEGNDNYQLFRVNGTRIAFSIPSNSPVMENIR